MKKISVMLLAMLMLFAFVACDNSAPEVPEEPISERYPDADYTKVILVSTAAELTEALNSLQADTKIVLAAGTYDMKDSEMTDSYASQNGWMFLVNEDDVAIVAADDAEVTILANDETPNGALASQDMITIVSDNVVLAGLKIGTRYSDNKAIDVIGNNATIDSCTFIDGSALYIAEYDQNAENTIDKVTVKNSVFEEKATISITNGVSGDVKFTGNTMKNGSALYLTGSRNSGWNQVGIDVSAADFSGNSFEAGSMLRIAYEADDTDKNSSLISFDASAVADNLGEAEESTGSYGETIKLYTAN